MMTITPDELKQIVLEAVFETMSVKNEMKYYTRHEACEIPQISLSSLDTYVKKGAIRCSHVGKRVLFSQDDIDKSLGKNRIN